MILFNISPVVEAAVIIFTVFIFAVLAHLIGKKVLLRLAGYFIKRSKNKWDDILLEKKVFEKLVWIMPASVIHYFSSFFPAGEEILQRIMNAFILFILMVVIADVVSAFNEIYERFFPGAKDRPIKGILQSIIIILYFAGLLVIISVILGRDPALMLSGIGAMTAVILLIFKDTILSFVAGLKLTSTKAIREGDWITMPQYNADGNVVDMGLYSINIHNWDNTVTSIPTHKFLEDSFTSWRSMVDSGARRIARSLRIDMSDIKFLSEKELDELKKISLIKSYITKKHEEIREKNSNPEKNPTQSGLTNIGVFRMYIHLYISSHPDIRQDMIHMVRQLEPTEKGIPLQIYAFSATTVWTQYEGLQADIFDHLMAIAGHFYLRVYQFPTGRDFHKGAEYEK